MTERAADIARALALIQQAKRAATLGTDIEGWRGALKAVNEAEALLTGAGFQPNEANARRFLPLEDEIGPIPRRLGQIEQALKRAKAAETGDEREDLPADCLVAWVLHYAEPVAVEINKQI